MVTMTTDNGDRLERVAVVSGEGIQKEKVDLYIPLEGR